MTMNDFVKKMNDFGYKTRKTKYGIYVYETFGASEKDKHNRLTHLDINFIGYEDLNNDDYVNKFIEYNF